MCKLSSLLLVAVLFTFASASAQGVNIREVFKQMPDTLLPHLTTNNRLDMLDFMDARMKAEVTNQFDGKSEMLALTDDSLSIRVSSVLRVDMKIERADSAGVVFLWKTYCIKEGQSEVLLFRYTPDWQLVSSEVIGSTLLKRDEEVFAKPHF